MAPLYELIKWHTPYSRAVSPDPTSGAAKRERLSGKDFRRSPGRQQGKINQDKRMGPARENRARLKLWCAISPLGGSPGHGGARSGPIKGPVTRRGHATTYSATRGGGKGGTRFFQIPAPRSKPLRSRSGATPDRTDLSQFDSEWRLFMNSPPSHSDARGETRKSRPSELPPQPREDSRKRNPGDFSRLTPDGAPR